MTRILIIDDEDVFREDTAALLRLEGYECETAPDGPQGLSLAVSFEPNAVLCDLAMPGMHGLEVIEKLAECCPECAILVITAHATLDSAVQAFRLGATDLILKPVVLDVLTQTLRQISEIRKLRAEVGTLRRTLTRRAGDLGLVGCSAAMADIRNLVDRVALRDNPVLISGESGTGKEVVAQAIHQASPRCSGPFAAFNCSAVSETLFESEIFGHAKGAFTGAWKRHKGYFEMAADGTLLLDEIGEVSTGHQAKLLRAIEAKEILRVGESKPLPVRARILASTNRDLASMVEQGDFRADLFYRLKVIQIEIPPLRERLDDIPMLVDHFLSIFSEQMNLRCVEADATAMDMLLLHDWPGNVRELKNTLERALIVGDGACIRVENLPQEVTGEKSSPRPSGAEDDLRFALAGFEHAHLRRVLRRTGGNRAEAARRLGIDVSTLWRKLSNAK